MLGDGVADGDGDCVLPASELQDANMIAKMRKMDCFFIETPSEVFFGVSRPTVCVTGAGVDGEPRPSGKRLRRGNCLE